MRGICPISPRRLTRFHRDESGASLVELAVVVPIMLLLIFGLIDFSRMGFSYVMASKATDRAVRMAVVNPPVCTGVPRFNNRGSLDSSNISYKTGTSCSVSSGLCDDPGRISCTATLSDSTAASIWNEIRALMPTNATEANLRFSYEFNSDLGFLGGPYTPIVTVGIQNLDFEFVTPLGALATMAGAVGQETLGSNFAFPTMSASLPGEALFDGGNS